MYWGNLLREVLAKKARGKKFSLNERGDDDQYFRMWEYELNPHRKLKAYSLGRPYGEIYFTKREAECMLLFLKGKTIENVAELLALSARTVEYYLKNMKSKLGCRTKCELVEMVHASDFVKNLDF